MAFDQTKPATTDNYSTAFTQNIQANQAALAMWLDSTYASITGTPVTYGKRYNRASGLIEEYNGSVWGTLPLNIGGNAATATTCSGNAGTVTNGVYTSGDQTIAGTKTFSSMIAGSVNGSSASCTGNALTSSSTTGNAANLTPSGTTYTVIGTWGAAAGAIGTFLVNRAYRSDLCDGNAATSSSCSGNAATSSSCSGNAATATGQSFSYTNSDNNPSYLWGTNANGSAFLAARGSMSVNYANTAGSAPANGGTSAACSGNAATATTATNLSGGSVTATTITATGDITAFYSDDRLKDRVGLITDPLARAKQLQAFLYRGNALAKKLGYSDERVMVGLSAQDAQRAMPWVVRPAPFDLDEEGKSISGEDYLTLQYEKLVPLLLDCVNALTAKVEALEAAK
jgi:hypothetical protein